MPETQTSTPSGTLNRESFEPIAGILALILPGAGHVYLKETWRGLGVAAGVLGLFFGGILIGGIDAVDSKEDRIWFLGQALVGPIAFGVDRYHQANFKAFELVDNPSVGQVPGKLRSGYPDERREKVSYRGNEIYVWRSSAGQTPPNSKSVAHLNEIGTLFATIAGMLNLIAVLDALFHRESRAEIIPEKGEA